MAQRAEGSHKGSNAKSVSKTLEILSTFNELAPEQRTSDIANKLHMNISTVSRHPCWIGTFWSGMIRLVTTRWGWKSWLWLALHYKIMTFTVMPILNCSSCLISTASTAIWECPVQWMWYI